VVALVIIGSLLAVAFPRLWQVQVEGERAALEKVVTELQTAVGIDVATYVATGNSAGLRSLEGSNPMERLAEAPWNYRGTVDGQQSERMTDGTWYFNTRERVLIYRVRNAEYFRAGGDVPGQARFAVRLLYADRRPKPPEIVGAQLVKLEPYTWVLSGQEH
jgi:general secretion pathway protein G